MAKRRNPELQERSAASRRPRLLPQYHVQLLLARTGPIIQYPHTACATSGHAILSVQPASSSSSARALAARLFLRANSELNAAWGGPSDARVLGRHGDHSRPQSRRAIERIRCSNAGSHAPGFEHVTP